MSQDYLEIIAMNGQASIQDLGRLKAQHLGFSASGAADEFAFLSANKLIANRLSAEQHEDIAKLTIKQSNCAAIEITLGQINFKASAACTIAITGAECHVKINNVAISHWRCHQLQAGDIIEFAMPKKGLHSYLAVMGGFTCHEKQQAWLGSFAQTRNEMALGFTGEVLTTNHKLFFAAQTNDAAKTLTTTLKANTPKSAPTLFYASESLTLRMIASDLFLKMSPQQQQRFLATEYVISADSNRMGYRLAVKKVPTENILPLALRRSCLLSKPVSFGMVQFPENEQPIILMKERQTMGGYPVLGTVMQTDLFRLSQMRPGEKVTFRLTNHQQAVQQLQAFYEKLGR